MSMTKWQGPKCLNDHLREVSFEILPIDILNINTVKKVLYSNKVANLVALALIFRKKRDDQLHAPALILFLENRFCVAFNH